MQRPRSIAIAACAALGAAALYGYSITSADAAVAYPHSAHVTIVNGSAAGSVPAPPTTGTVAGQSDESYADFTFVNVDSAGLASADLSGQDTVVLNQVQPADLTGADQARISSFVTGGGKLIIHDSDGTNGNDYSWLPAPARTGTSCPNCGNTAGSAEVVEDSTLASGDKNDTRHFVNMADLPSATDAIGDGNVMTTQSPAWFVDIKADNGRGQTGAIHTYAAAGSGLIIYNGFDQDAMGSPLASGVDWLGKLWYLELAQPWSPDGLPRTTPVNSDPLTLSSWHPGDVHVHSTGDASLRDNLICRQQHLIPSDGSATAAQEASCSRYLIGSVMQSAQDHGLQWAILAEHGAWLGINAPGNDPRQLTRYSESEAHAEWGIIRDQASDRSHKSFTRLLMGEEIGTAPPVSLSGHFSTYYEPDFVADSPFLNSEGKFLSAVQTAGGFGAINHPGTGSTWGCWFTTDKRCPGGVAQQFPTVVKGVEVYTATKQPIDDVLDRWDGLLERGLQVAAVGGGDTHTVSRISPFDNPGLSSGRQKPGNIDELGLDGRARTYVLGPELTPRDTFTSNMADDPVRTALQHGQSLASNGPLAAITLDAAAPSDRILPTIPGGHVLKLRWQPANGNKVSNGFSRTYGDPTAIRVVVGQRVDPSIKADCGTPRDPYRKRDCIRTVNVPLKWTTSVQSSDLTYTLPDSLFPTFHLRQSSGSLEYQPSTFARVEIEFGRRGDRGVYSSPFYLQGTSTQLPNF